MLVPGLERAEAAPLCHWVREVVAKDRGGRLSELRLSGGSPFVTCRASAPRSTPESRGSASLRRCAEPAEDRTREKGAVAPPALCIAGSSTSGSVCSPSAFEVAPSATRSTPSRAPVRSCASRPLPQRETAHVPENGRAAEERAVGRAVSTPRRWSFPAWLRKTGSATWRCLVSRFGDSRPGLDRVRVDQPAVLVLNANLAAAEGSRSPGPGRSHRPCGRV